MTNAEAIEILRANYPDACHEQLREAVDAAVEALKAQDAAGDTIIRQTAIDALAEEMPTPYTLDGSHPADEGIFYGAGNICGLYTDVKRVAIRTAGIQDGRMVYGLQGV